MKKLLRIALPLILSVFSVSAHSYCKSVMDLSETQRETLVQAYEYGEPYGYGYSLAAIAWKESMAGVYKINYSDPSFGVFHNLLTTVARREGVTSGFVKNQLAQRLVDDFEYSASHAIAELNTWRRYHKGDIYLTWASYNAGTYYKAGIGYADNIKSKVQTLQRCMSGEFARATQIANMEIASK